MYSTCDLLSIVFPLLIVIINIYFVIEHSNSRLTHIYVNLKKHQFWAQQKLKRKKLMRKDKQTKISK